MAVRKLFFLWPIFVFLLFHPFLFRSGRGPISINFWPFFQYTSDPVEGVKEIEGLGPFFYMEKRSASKTDGEFARFSIGQKMRSNLSGRFEFLIPSGNIRMKEGDTKGVLVSTVFIPESRSSTEREDGTFNSFPFFIGETEKGERLFWASFPSLALLFERYGKDEIRFYLWPLYGESTSEGVRTTNLLWPISLLHTRERKREGYRILAFLWPKRRSRGFSNRILFMANLFEAAKRAIWTRMILLRRAWSFHSMFRKNPKVRQQDLSLAFFSHAVDRLTGFEQWTSLGRSFDH